MIATDPLSLVFLGCVAVSLLFYTVSLATGLGHLDGGGGNIGHVAHVGHVGHAGHLADAGHAGHTGHVAADVAPTNSPLTGVVTLVRGAANVYGALLFLLVFGLLGYPLRNIANAGVVLTLLLAFVVAAACSLLLGAALVRLFVSVPAQELGYDTSRLEGRLGTVSLAIRPGGLGEVLFRGATGGRQSLGARAASGDAIPAGAEVVILGYRDGIASVETWDRFMAQVRGGQAPALESLGPLAELPAQSQ